MNPFFNIFLAIFSVWGIIWKLYAVWTAVKNDQKKWFIALLFLNTFGILEMYYILKVRGVSWSEVEMDFKNAWRSMIGEPKIEHSAEGHHDHHDHGHGEHH